MNYDKHVGKVGRSDSILKPDNVEQKVWFGQGKTPHKDWGPHSEYKRAKKFMMRK